MVLILLENYFLNIKMFANGTFYDVNHVFAISQFGFKSYANYTQNLDYNKYELDKVNAALEISELLIQLKEKTI